VMEGRTLNCGSVAALENIRHPTAVARRVMEQTPHILLVGEGARLFAVQQGFPLESLVTPQSVSLWQERQGRRTGPSSGTAPSGHDTVAVLALDSQGSLAGACTTSGLAGKLPGRVGDS